MRDQPMRICSESEVEELLQLRARVAALEAERDELRHDLEDTENEAIRLRDDLNAHQKIGAEATLRNVRVDKITEGYRNLHVKQYHQIQNLKKALEGFLNALEDGPENCSYLKYEEVRDAALKELGDQL